MLFEQEEGAYMRNSKNKTYVNTFITNENMGWITNSSMTVVLFLRNATTLEPTFSIRNLYELPQ